MVGIDMERNFIERSLINALLRKVMVEMKADTEGLSTSKVMVKRIGFIWYQWQQGWWTTME